MNMTKTRLYSIQTRKNRVGFVSCSHVVSNFTNPKGNHGSKCETPENPYFLRKGKMVISVKIQNFSRSRMMKRTTPLESSREI